MTAMQKYKFAHLWLSRNGQFIGRATAAFTSNGANQITVAYSFCNPADRYYRAKGRMDAVKAYENNEVVSFVEHVRPKQAFVGQSFLDRGESVGPVADKPTWAPAATAAATLEAILGGRLSSKVKAPSWAKKKGVKVSFNGETSLDIRSQHRPTFDYLSPEPQRRRWMVISQVEQGDAFCAGPFPSKEEAELVQRVVLVTDPTVKIIEIDPRIFQPPGDPQPVLEGPPA